MAKCNVVYINEFKSSVRGENSRQALDISDRINKIADLSYVRQFSKIFDCKKKKKILKIVFHKTVLIDKEISISVFF